MLTKHKDVKHKKPFDKSEGGLKIKTAISHSGGDPENFDGVDKILNQVGC